MVKSMMRGVSCFFYMVILWLTCVQIGFAEEAKPADESDSYNPWTAKRLTGDWGGSRKDLEDIGFKLDLSYQQQYQQNFLGGLDTHNGQRLSGSYEVVIKLDFGKMDLIPNAGFYFKTKGTWGDGINSNKVGASGAARVNSDAEGDHPVFVKKWWYWHKFLDDKVELRLGVLETKKDLFDISLYANHEDKDFLNRLSFQNATIPHRTGMGAYIKIQPTDWFYFLAAGLDAQSRARRTGFDTAFHNEALFVGMWELGFTPTWESSKGPMPGRYRVGFWYDSRVSTVYERRVEGHTPSRRGDDVGFYLGIDQMIWKENDDAKDYQGLGLFARYGHAHGDINRISDYWSSGVSYKGLIPTRDRDVMAFGVSQALYSTMYRHNIRPLADRETVYEWYYKFYLTPWCDISPDLQIVTNPGGDKDDRDAIVGGVRLRIIF
ncbi:MAG: carbohydrate porin [Planctomycetota bacterium]